MRKVTRIAAIAMSLMALVSPAKAQMPAPELINTPVQDQWRGPFEGFLRELRVIDPAAMIAKTNAFQIGGIQRPDSIFFRIEDAAVCSEDMCFAVIGRVIDNKFVADAMFAAGKRFTRSDHIVPLFGFQTVPAWLIGDKVTVRLLETPVGWIVSSSLDRVGPR